MKKTATLTKTWNEKASSITPTYAPMVEACLAHGISRSVAHELMNAGLIETFKIGARRYVMLESLRTLPERLKGAKQ